MKLWKTILAVLNVFAFVLVPTTQWPTERRLDITVVLDDTEDVTKDDYGSMMKTVGELRDVFPMRDQGPIRVALMSLSNYNDSRPFISDPNEFSKEIVELTNRRAPSSERRVDLALKRVRQMHESEDRENVDDVVILVTSGCPTSRKPKDKDIIQGTINVAKQLLSSNFKIFVIHVDEESGGESCKKDGKLIDPERHELEMVGNKSSHRIRVPGFDQLNIEVFRGIKKELLPNCNYKPLCYYKSSGECASRWILEDDDPDCEQKEPSETPPKCETEQQCRDNCSNFFEKKRPCLASSACNHPKDEVCEACKRCESILNETAASTTNGTSEPIGLAQIPTGGRGADGKKEEATSIWVWIVLGIAGVVLIALLAVLGVVVRNRRRRRESTIVVGIDELDLEVESGASSKAPRTRSRSRSRHTSSAARKRSRSTDHRRQRARRSAHKTEPEKHKIAAVVSKSQPEKKEPSESIVQPKPPRPIAPMSPIKKSEAKMEKMSKKKETKKAAPAPPRDRFGYFSMDKLSPSQKRLNKTLPSWKPRQQQRQSTTHGEEK